jgi:transposase
MEQWMEIRRRVLAQGVSKRQILRETGMHWTTLEKILAQSEPPGYRQAEPRKKRKIGPWLGRIETILKADKELPRKQRHSAKRLFERLREEGYEGGYTAVKQAVREHERLSREVFVPLSHRPGEAQVDFGEALARIGGALRKVKFFVMSLPYSGVMFVMAFERECTETFWEGHVRAFERLAGVPHRITYDNSRIAVSQILGAHERKLTRGFLQLKSHYLFDHHFCRVRRANEKGVVEGAVKYARLNFMVPVPEAPDLAALNERLWEACWEDGLRTLRGHRGRTKHELLGEERAAFLPLPPAPFPACRLASTAASSLSLVRFDDNDYSVPVAYAHRPIVVKGFMDRVELCHKGQVVATHERLWDKQQIRFEPVHYLELLERKPGALDYALPLESWRLPECFAALRRRLELELEDGSGTREYIGVLRLLEKHPLEHLTRAVERALEVRAHRRDAVAQFLRPREDWRATTFSLDGREHLRGVKVAGPDLAAYCGLLGEGGAS